jgi:hypothetical protein
MTWTVTSFSRRFKLLLALPLALGVWISGGCGNDDNGPAKGNTPPTTTTFTGVFANPNENGSFDATIQSTNLAAPVPGRLTLTTRPQRSAATSVSASGTLTPIGGSAIPVTGTYDDAADSLHLSGGGYFLEGEYDTSGTFQSISGAYTGPNGPGFFGCVTGVSNPTAYCGTFASSSTSLAGNWDIVIAGGDVGGVAFPATGDPFAFEGTIETTGTMRAITGGNGQAGVYLLTVTGTLDTSSNTVSGSWTYDDLVTPSSSDAGTWSGSPCP